MNAATVPGLWPVGKQAAVGASLVSDLHPVAVQAIVEIAQQRTRRPLLDAPAATEQVTSGGRALGEWLLDIASAASNSGLTEEELLYFVTSGAGRARAIALALRGLPTRRPLLEVIDSGTGVGMIPWLLTFDFPDMRSVRLLEPSRRYLRPLSDLWASKGSAQQWSVVKTRAEDADYGEANADMAMFCQCLLRIKPHRRQAVLEQAWRALRPGGVLLINEALRDSSTPEPKRAPFVGKDELMAIMPGRPQLFWEKSGWQRPEDLQQASAQDIGYSGLMIAVREG